MAESFNQATEQNPSHFALEQYNTTLRQQNGLLTELPMVVNNNVTLGQTNLEAINQNPAHNVNWALGGAPAAGTTGNNTTMVAGTIYWVQLFLENAQTLTGAQFLIGATAGTDKWTALLYNNSGVLVANSSIASQTVASLPNTLVSIPFTSTLAAPGPGTYFLGLQSTGTTAKFQSYTVSGAAYGAGDIASTTATQIAIANATLVTYTNNVGPIACVY